jgi:hypothetical protein
MAGSSPRSAAVPTRCWSSCRPTAQALIVAGHAEPFAPAGRVFREWAALPRPDPRRWWTLLNEAKRFAVSAAA